MKNIIIALLANTLLWGCQNQPKEMPNNEKLATPPNEVVLTEAQNKNVNIETGLLRLQPVSTILKLNGTIDVPPQNMVQVSAPMGGYVKSTKLLPGMLVSKGEAIAILEDEKFIQLQQDYLLAKSRLHFATMDFDRQKELNKTQASSDRVKQQALAEVEAQQVILAALAEKLRLINIKPEGITATNISKTTKLYSEINGIVGKVNVGIGKYVAPSDVLFEIIDPSDIHLNLKVFEKDIARLAIGQRLTAYRNTSPEKKYLCEVILINKEIGPDGTADVHCHFGQNDPSLLPGMYMNAEVALSPQKYLVLPEQSVVSFEGKEYVFIQKAPLVFQMCEVVTGLKENGSIALLHSDSLKEKRIVTHGAYTLLMKMKNTEEP